MAETNTDALPHGVHGQRRRGAALRRDDRHQRAAIARRRFASRSIRRAVPVGPAPWRATSSRCARAKAACCSASGTPKPRSISRGSPGSLPAGVICEILNDDGTTARRPELELFAQQHGLTFITVAQLVAHRLKNERLVHRVAEARLPTDHGSVADHRLPERRRRARARRARVRRHRRRRGRARAHALQVPHRRRLPLAALRLRLAARQGDGDDRRRRARRDRVPRSGRAAASACSTSSRRTSCRTAAPTRSRRTSSSASSPTCATTASARRSCSTSASSPSGRSRTTRARWSASRATACGSASACRSSQPAHDENADYLRTKRDKLGHLLAS